MSDPDYGSPPPSHHLLSVAEARAQLSAAKQPMRATKRDIAVEAISLSGFGILYGVFAVVVEPLSDPRDLILAVVACLTVTLPLEWWRRRSVGVVPRVVDRCRRAGPTGSMLTFLVLLHLHAPRPVTALVVAAPCLVAAVLMVRRGRR